MGETPATSGPVDPDIDLHTPGRQRGTEGGPVLAAVALGGALGAGARYGMSVLWPTPAGGFPWATLAVNAAGCAAIGVLLVLLSEFGSPHRLLKPFAGAGFLGGFTTFSTYAADIVHLAGGGGVRSALTHLALTLSAALVAVWAATGLTRRAVRAATRGRST